tara:strand:+ start:100 stop:321 length:222 start_codon:yes stop_codon:yes gene_type:complete
MFRIRTSVILIGLVLLGATSASAEETFPYTYEAQGRVIKVERSGDANDGEQVDYEYDDAGNRTHVEATGEATP